MIVMSGWYGSAHISNSLTSACTCASHRQGTCRPYPKGFVRCSSWSEVPRRSAILGLGASLAASSISAGTSKLALAMSGAESIGRTDLDGLSISQARFPSNLCRYSCQSLAQYPCLHCIKNNGMLHLTRCGCHR